MNTVRLLSADLQSSFKLPSYAGPPCLHLSLLGDTTAIKIHQSDAVATLLLRQAHAPLRADWLKMESNNNQRVQ